MLCVWKLPLCVEFAINNCTDSLEHCKSAYDSHTSRCLNVVYKFHSLTLFFASSTFSIMIIWSSLSCTFVDVAWVVCDISDSEQRNGAIFKGSDIQEDWLSLEILIFGENWGPGTKRQWQKKSENLILRGEIGLKYRILIYYCCSNSTNVLEFRRLLE